MLTWLLYVHSLFLFFFFNDTATTEIYTLSLHDALPISSGRTRKSPRASGIASDAQVGLLAWSVASRAVAPQPSVRAASTRAGSTERRRTERIGAPLRRT